MQADVLNDLLDRTSRTFALAIPLLADPLRADVTLAYLLFRIADTLEDGPHLTRVQRIEALNNLNSLVRAPDKARTIELSAQWQELRPSDNQHYMDLLGKLPMVMDAVLQREPAIQQVILRHAERTIAGMADVVAGTDQDGHLRLEDLDALRKYCYIVAGIVGEMLTELFLARTQHLASVAVALRQHAPKFGEALQLVNILRDRANDAGHGRIYLPLTVDLGDIFDLARSDLAEAEAYIEGLRVGGAPAEYICFTSFPVLLARRTLELVAEAGPGAKLSRREVAELYVEVTENASR